MKVTHSFANVWKDIISFGNGTENNNAVCGPVLMSSVVKDLFSVEVQIVKQGKTVETVQ